jgi:glycosyltransferase involved in cell wall biosynthesis
MYLGFNLTEHTAPTKLSNDSTFFNPHTKKVVVLGHIQESMRTRRHASHNRKLVPYGRELNDYRSIFFPGDYRNTHRLLTHFYSYVFFADLREEHFYKRLVRDRLHYHDEIFCAAGRVLKLIHEDAARLSGLPLPTSQHSQVWNIYLMYVCMYVCMYVLNLFSFTFSSILFNRRLVGMSAKVRPTFRTTSGAVSFELSVFFFNLFFMFVS